jgi:putative ABC transport system permease protein
MRLVDGLGAALDALRANLLRSALTMLGMVIGVAAVILVVAIGTGARELIVAQIRSLGSNLLIVEPHTAITPGQRRGTSTLTEADAAAILQEVPSVQLAVPVIHGNVQLVSGDVSWLSVLYGTTDEFLTAHDWPIGSGRDFAPEEEHDAAKVALLGQSVAHMLFGDRDPVGSVIMVQRVPLTVIGVLTAKGQTSGGQDQDDVVMAPIRTVRTRVLGTGAVGSGIDTLLVRVADGQSMSRAQTDVTRLLRQRHRLQDGQADDFRIKNLAEVQQLKEGSAQALATLVAAVASVSLLVGGIGIMNIMLVSVVERTREIGIRIAVGARRRDIRSQFLIEATTLSGIGGAVGVVLGIVGAGLLAALAGWPWIISLRALLLAVGFSVTVGIVFGFYPARHAAHLDPIEALRHE